jgi:hypothetical protein
LLAITKGRGRRRRAREEEQEEETNRIAAIHIFTDYYSIFCTKILASYGIKSEIDRVRFNYYQEMTQGNLVKAARK